MLIIAGGVICNEIIMLATAAVWWHLHADIIIYNAITVTMKQSCVSSR